MRHDNEIMEKLRLKGLAALSKTAGGLADFAACVTELKNIGGSDFSKTAESWWGISPKAVTQWLDIGNSQLINSATKLPPAAAKTRKPRKGNKHSKAAKVLIDMLAGGETPNTQEGSRAKKIIVYCPELAEKVASGEMSVSAAKAQADIVAKKVAAATATPPNATKEELCTLVEDMAAIVNPAKLNRSLGSDFFYRGVVINYTNVRKALDTLKKNASRDALNFILDLTPHIRDQMHLLVQSRVELATAKEKDRLAAKEIKLTERAAYIYSKDRLINKEDIKLIKSCLHPDRAPAGQKNKFNKAFQAFENWR